jgi:hypothetical protein
VFPIIAEGSALSTDRTTEFLTRRLTLLVALTGSLITPPIAGKGACHRH